MMQGHEHRQKVKSPKKEEKKEEEETKFPLAFHAEGKKENHYKFLTAFSIRSTGKYNFKGVKPLLAFSSRISNNYLLSHY